MVDVSERRIRPIQEAVDSQKWRQALQLCEKWHKKGERSDRFLPLQAVRAFVLAKQHDPGLAKRGRDELLNLCNRDPAITHVDTIFQIQTTLNDLHLGEDGVSTLWQRAVAANSNDTNLSMAWLSESIDQCDWKAAQKATMALRKSSPQDRRHEFWAILMCFMIYQNHSFPEGERGMFGTLAYRMLSKAAGVNNEQGLQSSTKAIRSPEELYLLIRVYLETGHVQEAREALLNSRWLGPDSSLSKLDHDLHVELQLKVLQQAQDWPEIATRLRDGSAHPSTGDAVLSQMLGILFDAVEQSDRSDLLSGIRECLESRLKVCPTSLCLRHGMLSLCRIEMGRNRCTVNQFLEDLKLYFASRCERLSCFDEIRSLVQGLDPTVQQQVIQITRDIGPENSERPDFSIAPILNTRKIEYFFLVASNPSAEEAEGFANKVVRIYRECLDVDPRLHGPTTQLAMLACMAISRGQDSQQGSGNSHNARHISILKSGFLLRYCLSKSKDDYPTLVVLVRFLILLGSFSLGAKFFDQLGVKNLQWENAGHLLLARLSTLHPQRSRVIDDGFEPLRFLDLATVGNRNSVQSFQRHLVAGLDCESYVNVMDSIKLRDNMKRSLSRQLNDVESARIRRLRGLPSLDTEVLPEGPSVDLRDYSFIPCFEQVGDTPFADLLELGPRPKDGWLRSMLMCRRIADLLFKKHQDFQSINPHDVDSLFEAVKALKSLLESARGELTSAELQNCEVQFQLGRALQIQLEQAILPIKSNGITERPDGEAKGSFEGSLQHLRVWLTNTLEQQELSPSLHPSVVSGASTLLGPSWEYLHGNISTLESLQLISLFLARESKALMSQSGTPSSNSRTSTKLPVVCLLSAEEREGIERLVVQTEASIHASAETMKQALSAAGVLGKMVDTLFDRRQSDGAGDDGAAGGMGAELGKLPGAETLAETFCADVIESWIDALDGILSIKVKGVSR